MKKVLFYSNIPSPYRVDFFNELGKHCDLTVIFELSYSPERDDKWKDYNFKNFKGIVLDGKRISTDTAFCPNITKYLKAERYDEVVVTVLASPTAILAVNWLKRHHIPYIYEGDGGFIHPDNKIKYLIKKRIISGAKYCFSTSKAFDEYCINYGASFEGLIRYPLSSICNEDIIPRCLSLEEKSALKENCHMAEKKCIVSVGQMIERKGFDILLKAAKNLSDEWGIYLIGGNATKELEELVSKLRLENKVHFLDFMDKKTLWKYYQAADLFLLPTREDIWGLVVNEAMANGLPVVSSDKCIAALEMVEDEKNGYIFQSENTEELGQVLKMVNDNPLILVEMAENAREKAYDFTIEKMVDAHIKQMKL